jgi:hypothetical protein
VLKTHFLELIPFNLVSPCQIGQGP